MSGVVSETISLSITQAADAPGVLVNATRNADGSVTVNLNGSARDLKEVRLPVQIRSNVGYRLYASAEARGADLSGLLVNDAHATGNLVTPNAAEALRVSAPLLNRPDLSARTQLLSGPRVSLGGALQSPHNALEVTLTISVEPRADEESWTVELRLSAEPGDGLQ
jgi:hypothetical protein